MQVARAGTGEIQAGDRAGVFLKLKPDIELKRGGVLYDPKTKPQVLMNHGCSMLMSLLAGQCQLVGPTEEPAWCGASLSQGGGSGLPLHTV